MDYSSYTTRIMAHGDSARKRVINHSKYKFDKSFERDPSYKENVEIVNKGFVNIQMDGREVIQGIPTMNIRAKLEEPIRFVMGDTFFYDDGYWLCTDSSTFHETYRKGCVEECNYLLSWQNKETLSIIQKWCVIKSPYSSGVDESKIITVGNSKYKIKLPYDDETRMFNYQSRFLISLAGGNPIAYKLIDFDDATNKNDFRKDGFLVIIVQQDEGQEDDNKELMIANYREKPEPPTPSIGFCEIIYSGEPVIKVGGSPKRFTAIFKDNDGNTIDSIDPQWEIIADPEIVNKIVISYQLGNEIGIEVQDSVLIGTVFVLKVSGEHNDFGYFENQVNCVIENLW